MVRKIIHIDMDAFFASIEQRDHPQYRNKPLVVGGAGRRGVVAAASYEARKYGIHSAMPMAVALKNFPGLIIARPRFEVYQSVSREIMKIFKEYTDLVEPLSLDEAFLDVTVNKKNIETATQIAEEIKLKIKNQTKLTASAGLSVNKFLAKVASDMDKPDGLYIIRPEEAEAFVEKLPVEKFYGVGRVTAEKMHDLKIYTGADLRKLSLPELIRLFGKNGKYFYGICRAIDERQVNPVRIRKSYGTERTFELDLNSWEEVTTELTRIADILWDGLEKSSFKGKTLTVKIRYDDFKQITRSRSFNRPLDSYQLLLDTSLSLTEKEIGQNKKIRLLGISISNSEENDNQLDSNSQLRLDI